MNTEFYTIRLSEVKYDTYNLGLLKVSSQFKSKLRFPNWPGYILGVL